MRASFLTIRGVPTRFYHHGAGAKGVLLLHGVGAGADSFLWNLEGLGIGRTALAPDLLGYGLTGDGDYVDGPPQDSIVEHLAAFIQQIGISELCIVGSSFGAAIACLLTFRLGSQVDRLVLVGCGPALNEPAYLHSMYQQSFENGLAAMSDPTLDRCQRRLRNLVFDPQSVPAALPLIQLSLYGLPDSRDRYERRMRGIMSMDSLERYDVTGRLHEIDVPTLVIWGQQDIRGDLAEAERNFKKIRKAEMIVIDDCGHLPYLEKPELFNSIVNEFIS